MAAHPGVGVRLLPALLLPLVLPLLVGCSGAAAPVSTPAAASAETIGKEVLWVRDAAEYRALVVQTYRLAAAQLERLAAGLEPGRWVVILDADETLISNLGYSLRLERAGETWSFESWERWVFDRQAEALPGALDFVDEIRRLGGRVAVVTNRSEVHCEATAANLRSVGFDFDLIRCRAPGEEGKEGRWEEIRSGRGTGLGPLETVMWVGDNILDFPGLDQSSPIEAMDLIGVRYFVLPNPLYGSWEE